MKLRDKFMTFISILIWINILSAFIEYACGMPTKILSIQLFLGAAIGCISYFLFAIRHADEEHQSH